MSVIGGFLLLVLLVCGALVTMKVVPVWIEYFSLKKILATMANSGDLNGNGTPMSVRQAFDRRADIDNVTVVTSRDLSIKRDGGEYVVSFQYQSTVPLFGNASLVFDFTGSSKNGPMLANSRQNE
jgi:hypothetical protein